MSTAKPQPPREGLISLINDIFSVPCISIASVKGSRSNDYQTTGFLLRESRSASLEHLVELSLQLLLGLPPFTHTSRELQKSQQSIFFVLWNRDQVASENGLGPELGLQLLSRLRTEFQRLKQEAFQFVAELLLSCLQRLSPEGSSKGLNTRGWVNAHANGVNIISELLYSVPVADWLSLDTDAEHAVPLFRSLLLLCSGATWWRSQSSVYRENLENLARRFCSIPTAAFLLRASLRVELKPLELHSIVTCLVSTLEAGHGISESDNINAFTPTPFNFPLLSTLEKHSFLKDYEYANLRVLFVSWINGSQIHRMSEEFYCPWNMSAVLQHSEAFRKLKVHPQSAVRVALIYIFNEVQKAPNIAEGFKPSTDLKAMELLKTFVSYRHQERLLCISPTPSASSTTKLDKPESKPEACVIMNAKWVLPWMWRRRATDIDFVMVMTSAWLHASCAEDENIEAGHSICELVQDHVDAAWDVFHDLFKNVFRKDFAISSLDPKATLRQICRLLRTVLQVVKIITIRQPQLLTQQLCMLILRCFVDSVDEEWIPASCWSLACEVFSRIPRKSLSDAVKIAQVANRMNLFIPILLNGIEMIAGHCDTGTSSSLPVDALNNKLEILTTMLQFSVFTARAHSAIRTVFAKEPHFIASVIRYISQGYKSLFMQTSQPELAWTHAASVGAACELLVVTRLGTEDSPAGSVLENNTLRIMSEQTRNEEVMNLIVHLVGRPFEMSYVISPLCGLVIILSSEQWPKKPFIYLETFNCIRTVLLDPASHKWCTLFPAFVQAVAAMLKVDAPARQRLIENRWNLKLTATMLTRITKNDVHCPDCGIRFEESILRLIEMLLTRHPKWQTDLLETAGMETYSRIKLDDLESIFEKRLVEDRKLAELILSIIGTFPEWKDRVRVLQRRFTNATTGVAKTRDRSLYRIYRPIATVPFCIVPW